jgi:hypothetical protein
MNLNLLFDIESLDWENMSINKSECLDKIQEIISQIQIDGHSKFKPISFDDLNFSWGDIHQLFDIDTLRTLNAEWFMPYAYGTFSQIYTFPLTPDLADNLDDLKAEFPNDCNALLGCSSTNKAVVYDLNTYKTVQIDCQKPKLKIPANQINQLINTRYKHLFERLDTPTQTAEGALHGEQIQVHLNNGSTKNIGALNINGSWKHKPQGDNYQLPNESKMLLIEWGFKLPKE